MHQLLVSLVNVSQPPSAGSHQCAQTKVLAKVRATPGHGCLVRSGPRVLQFRCGPSYHRCKGAGSGRPGTVTWRAQLTFSASACSPQPCLTIMLSNVSTISSDVSYCEQGCASFRVLKIHYYFLFCELSVPILCHCPLNCWSFCISISNPLRICPSIWVRIQIWLYFFCIATQLSQYHIWNSPYNHRFQMLPLTYKKVFIYLFKFISGLKKISWYPDFLKFLIQWILQYHTYSAYHCVGPGIT